MTPQLETRAFAGVLEIREVPAGSEYIGNLAGLAVPYDRPSRPVTERGRFKGFIERFAVGSLTKTLRENQDVLFLFGHDLNAPVARTPKTLSLMETREGLRFNAHLPDTVTARDLLANVKSGVVGGMSFAFRAIKETWKEADPFDLRTVLEAELEEISAVAMPCYPDATVASRMHQTACEIRAACPELDEVMVANGRFEYGDGRTPLRDYWQQKIAETMAKFE